MEFLYSCVDKLADRNYADVEAFCQVYHTCMPSASNSAMTQVDNNGQPGNGQLQRDKDNQQNAPLPSFAK